MNQDHKLPQVSQPVHCVLVIVDIADYSHQSDRLQRELQQLIHNVGSGVGLVVDESGSLLAEQPATLGPSIRPTLLRWLPLLRWLASFGEAAPWISRPESADWPHSPSTPDSPSEQQVAADLRRTRADSEPALQELMAVARGGARRTQPPNAAVMATARIVLNPAGQAQQPPDPHFPQPRRGRQACQDRADGLAPAHTSHCGSNQDWAVQGSWSRTPCAGRRSQNPRRNPRRGCHPFDNAGQPTPTVTTSTCLVRASSAPKHGRHHPQVPDSAGQVPSHHGGGTREPTPTSTAI